MQMVADMLMVMVQVLSHLQMTDLLAELHIFYYKIKGEVQERKAWGQEVKWISTSMEVEVNNKQITDLKLVIMNPIALWMHAQCCCYFITKYGPVLHIIKFAKYSVNT